MNYNERFTYILNGCDEGIDNRTWLRIEIKKLIDQAISNSKNKLSENIMDYLNENMVEPEEHLEKVVEIIGLEFTGEEYGWQQK